MENMPGSPLIKDYLEADAPTKTFVMDKELAVQKNYAQVLPDQPKTQTIATTKV
jgi:hypothetical protein